MENNPEKVPCSSCQQLERKTALADSQERQIGTALAAASSESEREWALEEMAKARRRRMQLFGWMREHKATCRSRNSHADPDQKKDVTVVCMYCKRVQHDCGGRHRWVAEESLPAKSRNLSHGICGECFQKHVPVRYEDGLQQTD